MIEHTVEELVTQRVMALALGYEDVNDHDTLRRDPLVAAVVGKADPTGASRVRVADRGAALAGKSTLNRLELAQPGNTHRYQKVTYEAAALDALLVDMFKHLPAGANPRFVVTSLPSDACEARTLYEQLYCARGDMENRIKEEQLALFADRTSSVRLRANQLRLYWSTLAYVLLHALRTRGLAATRLAHAQCNTLRLRLLKVAAHIRVTTRHIWVTLTRPPITAGSDSIRLNCLS